MDFKKLMPDRDEKKFMPLVVSVFILSIFAGLFLTVIVRKWMIGSVEVIKKIQAQDESRRLEKLLDDTNERR